MHQILRWRFLVVPALLVATALLSAGPVDGPPVLQKVAVGDGVDLHYLERGKGAAVVFVHGTLGDYSVWEAQLGLFAQTYRAIAYSRRYNYPNTNKLRPKHSATVEAEDLAALIKKLDLGKTHVVGHSYGGYAALFLAVKHPDLVRTLTLAEPPVVFAGDRVADAKVRVVKRARAAFEKGDTEGAVRAVVDASRPGAYDKIPEPQAGSAERPGVGGAGDFREHVPCTRPGRHPADRGADAPALRREEPAFSKVDRQRVGTATSRETAAVRHCP